MVAGTLAFLTCLSMAVLIQSGWFAGLVRDVGIRKEWLAVGLLLEALLLRVQVPPGGMIRLQVGMFLFIPFLFCLRKGNREDRSFLFSSVFFIGSSLFLLRELYWLEPAFSWGISRSLEMMIVLIIALVSSRLLTGRLLVASLGMWLGQFLVLCLHCHEMKPLLFGDVQFLDFFWLSLILLWVAHAVLQQGIQWVRGLRRLI